MFGRNLVSSDWEEWRVGLYIWCWCWGMGSTEGFLVDIGLALGLLDGVSGVWEYILACVAASFAATLLVE